MLRGLRWKVHKRCQYLQLRIASCSTRSKQIPSQSSHPAFFWGIQIQLESARSIHQIFPSFLQCPSPIWDYLSDRFFLMQDASGCLDLVQQVFSTMLEEPWFSNEMPWLLDAWYIYIYVCVYIYMCVCNYRRKFRSQTSDNMDRRKAEQGYISKSKCTKHLSVGPLLEVAMSKKCTPLWREAHFQVKMYKTHQVQTTFGSWDVEKVHAVVARSTFPSENVQNTPASDHFWKLRCRKSARRCGVKHISKSKC